MLRETRRADGRKPNGVDILSSTAKQPLRRAGDVNPPVTAGTARPVPQEECAGVLPAD